ncbi:MAG: helix-turn-helix domain-containing protein [Prevotellaceae bacterium]|nr:helix-turn-helix domain-containing protein [Prevotellaceae bacterium]
MRAKDITPITIEKMVKEHRLPHIANEVAYLDTLKRLKEITAARRMSLCIFMALCTEGVAAVTVNDRKRIISRNTVMLITDESVVDSINSSPDFDGIGIFISYKMLQEILKDISNMSGIFLLTHNHPQFEIDNDEKDTLLTCLGLMRKRIDTTSHHYRLEVVRLLILTMISDLRNAFERLQQDMAVGDRQSRAGRIFVDYIRLVERNYKQQRQVQWYAAMMGITPKYLCEAITAVSRRSPNEWIDKFVTTEIRNQLRHTDKRISEIAREMNFPTQSFFGKYFKENVGVSPTEYRNGIEK